MTKMRFHGDIHGKVSRFFANCTPDAVNIQLGDFGFGFVKLIPVFPPNTWFIRGNHDDPFFASAHDQFIQDGHVYSTWNEVKVMFVGGALSIDKHLRTEGQDWWPDEELSVKRLGELIDIYQKEKPDIMVTHDAPQCVTNQMFYAQRAKQYPSRTGQAFDAMWELHSPQRWVFGHYHKTKYQVIDGCQFQCVGEMEYVDVEL